MSKVGRRVRKQRAEEGLRSLLAGGGRQGFVGPVERSAWTPNRTGQTATFPIRSGVGRPSRPGRKSQPGDARGPEKAQSRRASRTRATLGGHRPRERASRERQLLPRYLDALFGAKPRGGSSRSASAYERVCGRNSFPCKRWRDAAPRHRALGQSSPGAWCTGMKMRPRRPRSGRPRRRVASPPVPGQGLPGDRGWAGRSLAMGREPVGVTGRPCDLPGCAASANP